MNALSKDLSFLELFIINTICYFDVFDYPLTLDEVHQYLYTGGMLGGEYSVEEIKDNLENNAKLKKIIATSRGFYFLTGREQIIDNRLNRYVLADKKFKLALRAIRFIKYLPFVKLVAVCNNLAFFNARKESDIDLFVITRNKRIWLARFFIVLIVAILGLRPPKTKVEDKLCLSFYISDENLNIAQTRIIPDDIYLIYWIATLFPNYQRENYYKKFIQANDWFKKYLPNFQAKEISYRYRAEDNWFNSFVYKSKEFFYSGFIGNIFEKLARFIQLKKMSQRKKDLAVHDDTKVIISDQILKFHENDRRLEFLAKFEKKVKEIIDKI